MSRLVIIRIWTYLLHSYIVLKKVMYIKILYMYICIYLFISIYTYLKVGEQIL